MSSNLKGTLKEGIIDLVRVILNISIFFTSIRILEALSYVSGLSQSINTSVIWWGSVIVSFLIAKRVNRSKLWTLLFRN
jgi:hypothetical protein